MNLDIWKLISLHLPFNGLNLNTELNEIADSIINKIIKKAKK